MIDTAKLQQITILDRGAHAADSGALCAMEAVAWIAGEAWSDHPQCVSPVIAEFMRSWNDTLPDATRTTLLRPLLPLVIGTRTTDADEETRAWMAVDWLVRVHAPAWLRLAGLTDHAQAMASLSRITDSTVAKKSHPTIAAARYAARAAARYAAGDAAWDAAWDAARDAARYAAWDAAWDAARDAAGDAAGDAAWDAAWDAAGDAAWDAAGTAARTAAWTAARDAAGDAAGTALAPTVAALQASAVQLVQQMCAVGRDNTPEMTP